MLDEPQGELLNNVINNSNPVSFLLNNKKAILIGLLLLATAGLFTYQFVNIKIKNVQISYLKSKIQVLESDLEFQKNETNKCVTNFENLSDSIKNISDMSIDIKNSVNTLVPKINQIRNDTNTTVDIINNEPNPQTCEQAMEFLYRWYK